jgi:hypothetical protein
MLVLYLDTNHLSRLARFPAAPDCLAVQRLLNQGELHLALTWIHLQELSSPKFKSRALVGAFLDEMQVAWAPAPDEVFDREILWAIHLALTSERIDESPFSTSFVHAMAAPPEASILISEMLEAMAERSDLRAHLAEAAAHGAHMDSQFKRAAAVVRNPKEPILAHIRELNTLTTPSGLHLPRAFTPDEIFTRAGGLAGFPAINVAHSLARTRLRDEQFPADPNDVMDEWHACYAPYSVAVALDRGTAARFRIASLPDAHKVTHSLADIPSIVANRLTNVAADERAL